MSNETFNEWVQKVCFHIPSMVKKRARLIKKAEKLIDKIRVLNDRIESAKE